MHFLGTVLVPLSGIKSKQDQTPPLWICGREYALNFCYRKGTPVVVGVFANGVDKLTRVFSNVAIPVRLAKQRLEGSRCKSLDTVQPKFLELPCQASFVELPARIAPRSLSLSSGRASWLISGAACR